MFRLSIAALLVVAGLGAAYLVSLNHSRDWGQEATTTPEAFSQFSSEQMSLQFSYSNNYVATTTLARNGADVWSVVTLLPRGYVPPEAGDGPPAISVQVIPNSKNLPLDQWVLQDPRSNWQLAAHDGGLGSTTVGHEAGLAFKYSGLYNASVVAVSRNGMIYLFIGEWNSPGDRLYSDFQQVLNTVEFSNGQ